MNINTVLSTPIKLPPAAQPVPGVNPTPVHSKDEARLSAKEAQANAFYMREDEPWKKILCTESYCDEEPVTRPLTKEEYLEGLKLSSQHNLDLQGAYFEKFRRDLIEIRPDLAGKEFSYTLGDDAEIKILDANNTFSHQELEWLTTSVNKLSSFKNLIQTHAKQMMALVDHDTENFGNRYRLDLLNFQNTIDYGKILLAKKDQMHDTCIKQIHENAETRDKPLVNISA